MEVKYWVQEAPDIDAVRPRTCPCCVAAAMPLGGPCGLVGHGIRERQVLGPWREGSEPEALILKLRRYRCRHCEAIVMAAPCGLLRHVVYGAVAKHWRWRSGRMSGSRGGGCGSRLVRFVLARSAGTVGDRLDDGRARHRSCGQVCR